MRVLYFDCFSGISGDMVLGALLDLGIDHERFKAELEKLNLNEYTIDIEKCLKSGITGTDVHVNVIDAQRNNENNHEHSDDHDHDDEHSDDHDHDDEHSDKHEHDHSCEHNYENNHDNSHEHNHEHSHDHDQNSRNLFDIEALIDSSELNTRVKMFSKEIFKEIATAEAKVHNKHIYDVHFHEVGAVDSIVDIVGACICIDMLSVDRIYSSELRDGSGFVECQHGTIPVPVPAVMEMISESNIPFSVDSVNTELITPTGAGIIKTMANYFGIMPKMYVEKVGYGFGKKDIGRLNALRVVVGTLFEEATLVNEVSLLETNIDDISSEILGFVMEKLFENKALDVYFTPIYMKKNRPAVKLSVICENMDEEKMAKIIFTETTSLGIRKSKFERFIIDRNIETVNTRYGTARIKVAKMGECTKSYPEFEDCKELAIKHEVPLYEVFNTVSEEWKQFLK